MKKGVSHDEALLTFSLQYNQSFFACIAQSYYRYKGYMHGITFAYH